MVALPVRLAPIAANAVGSSQLEELLFRPANALELVVVGRSDNLVGHRYRYRFDVCRGLVVLDEGDLITIWESPHYEPNASILYEVVQGSIFESLSQRPGVLSVSMPQESLDALHEYLLATDDECVLVLSPLPPHVEELA